MIYKLPFTAISRALMKALTEEGNIEWFDCAVPIEEIEQYFQNRSEFEYGIIGAASITSDPNKDTVIWKGSVGLEIYSNYKGRKKIAARLEELLNHLSQNGFIILSEQFRACGYNLIRLSIGDMSINTPIYGNFAVWQSGVTDITFVLEQRGDE